MAENLSLNINIPEGKLIQINQDVTFENFIGQFQTYCSQLLCVINGTSLRYYNKNNIPNEIPTNIRFDYKQRREKVSEYYFRDIDDDTLYCVFGREAALIFYPQLDNVDPNGSNEPKLSIQIPGLILIKDNPNNNNKYQKKISQEFLPETRIINQNKFSPKPSVGGKSINQKRLPIIQPINSSSSISLFPSTPKKSLSTSGLQIGNNNNTKINRFTIPGHIVIIDKGIKLIFTNTNYPIEIIKFNQ